MTTSFLAAAGVELGDGLIPADAGNPLGYFEDEEFVELNGRMLESCTVPGDGGHRDWGFTESGHFDRAALRAFREEAQHFASRRAASQRPSSVWGLKDPRAALLLDFWDEIFGQPRYVFVYRNPWDVADSMQRLGAEVFLENPSYAYRLWSFYNSRLLSFFEKHRERAVLVSIHGLLDSPERFHALLEEMLDAELSAASMESLVDGNKLRTLEPSDPLIGLLELCTPDVLQLLEHLDEQANLRRPAKWRKPRRKKRARRVPAGGSADNRDPIELSVVLPCYNDGEFLLEAIASVERTVGGDYELIVVNDGSSEQRTLDVFTALRAAGYHVVDQENAGLSAARNRAIETARGALHFAPRCRQPTTARVCRRGNRCACGLFAGRGCVRRPARGRFEKRP